MRRASCRIFRISPASRGSMPSKEPRATLFIDCLGGGAHLAPGAPNSAQPSVSSAVLGRTARDPGRMNAASYASPALPGKHSPMECRTQPRSGEIGKPSTAVPGMHFQGFPVSQEPVFQQINKRSGRSYVGTASQFSFSPSGSYPLHSRTGKRGYFGNRESLADNSHRQKTDPRSDSTRCACRQSAQSPTFARSSCPPESTSSRYQAHEQTATSIQTKCVIPSCHLHQSPLLLLITDTRNPSPWHERRRTDRTTPWRVAKTT
jgi:hypothetical protein